MLTRAYAMTSSSEGPSIQIGLCVKCFELRTQWLSLVKREFPRQARSIGFSSRAATHIQGERGLMEAVKTSRNTTELKTAAELKISRARRLNRESRARSLPSQ